MNKRTRRKIEMGDRVIEVSTDPELAPTPPITALFTQLGAAVTNLKTSGTEQVSGQGVFRGGALECRRLSKEIRTSMRDIAEVAKVLKPTELIGARELFRMPSGNVNCQNLLAAARHFAEDVEPHKALFIARAMPATFVDDLEGMITAFESAIGQKADGRATHVGGTAGMKYTGKTVLGIVQELRAIMRNHLKAKPALLDAFKSAARLERDISVPAGSTPPSGGGSGTGTTPPSGS